METLNPNILSIINRYVWKAKKADWEAKKADISMTLNCLMWGRKYYKHPGFPYVIGGYSGYKCKEYGMNSCDKFELNIHVAKDHVRYMYKKTYTYTGIPYERKKSCHVFTLNFDYLDNFSYELFL